MRETDIKNTYGLLKLNPVSQMSLGSKELFHSNFLAWLGTDPELHQVFRNVMSAIGLSSDYIDSWGVDKYLILREKHHFDLLIQGPDKTKRNGEPKPDSGEYYLVIENKIKSIPSAEQLKKYSNELTSGFHKDEKFPKILLSIGEYDGPLPDDWSRATYSQVIEGLKAPRSGKISPYKLKLIEDYTSMLECLVKIMGAIEVAPDESYLPDPKTDEMLKELDKLRISDLYNKWRASKIATLVTEQLASYELNYTCDSGYTNKTPFIEIKIPIRGEKGSKDNCYCIGVIQIQGKQYRRCIEGPYNNSYELPKAFPGFMYDSKENFNDALTKEYPDVFQKSKMQGNYCCYGEKEKRPFWYQYVVIRPNTKISTIIDCIEKDIKKLKDFQTEEIKEEERKQNESAVVSQ